MQFPPVVACVHLDFLFSTQPLEYTVHDNYAVGAKIKAVAI